MMRTLLDVTMIVLTTAIMVRSLVRVTNYRSKSLFDFAILLLYVFQCLPVLTDLILGQPSYSERFIGFEMALKNDGVCIVYDIYIAAIFVALYGVSKCKKTIAPTNTSMKSADETPSFLLWVIILSPVIHIILSGNTDFFLRYATNTMRGMDASFSTLNSNLLILSIVAFFVWFFRTEINFGRMLVMLLFAFATIWISGKRYIVATILYCFFYMLLITHERRKRKLNIKFWIILAAAGLVIYSAYYITVVKVLTDGSFQSTYTMLRIDFGRDDVVKYTILEEYFKKDHILEYPGQSIISTFLMIVPRSIYPNKPYPHYRYLTASLYNTTIADIPSGMTPTILEMMIANFYWAGMPICILFLCWYCKKADNAKNEAQKLMYSLLLMVMLSQSVDSALWVFYLVLFFVFTSRITFVFNKRRMVGRY